MIKLICGLGNPGDRYQKTRHNAGFLFLDQWQDDDGKLPNWQNNTKFHSLIAKFYWHGQAVLLQKPQIFMNNSGRAVFALAQFYGFSADEILVVHDELDLPEGVVRLKKSGGHGGHNGLRDIIANLNNKDFYRLRLGIGRPADKAQVVDYVLKNFDKKGQVALNQAIIKAQSALSIWYKNGFEKAMNDLHK